MLDFLMERPQINSCITTINTIIWPHELHGIKHLSQKFYPMSIIINVTCDKYIIQNYQNLALP